MNKTHGTILFISLLLALLLSGCAGAEERAWRAGQKALAEENYSAAAASFEKAGSFQDAELLCRYARAWEALEQEDYTQAVAGFQALGDLKDSPLMVSYCQARQLEATAQTAFASDDPESAVDACHDAYTHYTALSLFRDSDRRAAACRDQLYGESTEWMNLGRYDAAASGFSVLGSWQDSDRLYQYCKAAALESRGSYAEAAELYAEIPDVLDAVSRADSARAQAYQLAAEMMNNGDYESAAEAFAALGSYQDAEQQHNHASEMQIRSVLQSGSYAEALQRLDRLSDPSVFPSVDPAEIGNLDLFLTGFLNAWMNAHAGVMTSFFSCSLLQPYLEPGGELDTLIRAELTDDTPPQNYGFIFSGAEIENLILLDEGFTAATVRGSASCIGPEGQQALEETLRILIDTTQGTPLAAAALPVR